MISLHRNQIISKFSTMKGLRILAISDTHTMHDKLTGKLPAADVLIHGGDFTNMGSEQNIRDFMKWFDSLNYNRKIFIAGNHETTIETDYFVEYGAKRFFSRMKRSGDNILDYSLLCRSLLKQSSTCTYLEDSSTIVQSNDNPPIKVYGSPWQPEFCHWAFNLNRGPDLANKWSKIPLDTDILITHGPPQG